MSPFIARLLLHTGHLVTFLALLATGLLLSLPTLRSLITGGYSLAIREAHCWLGVAFVAIPVVLIAACGPRAVFTPPAERTLRTLWQGAHLALTVALSAVLTVTGILLWAKDFVSEATVDSSLTVHAWFTYVAAAFVGLHLIDISVATVVARLQNAEAGATAPTVKP